MRQTDSKQASRLELTVLAPPRFDVQEHAIGAAYGSLATGSSLVLGDSLAVMSTLPAESVQTVVTSPPYWSLRDYGIAGQIGLEESVYAFVANLADVFDQVFRVLRPDGTMWLNIGDSYTSGNRGWRAPDKKNPARAMSLRPPTPEGLKDKDLIGVPWRLAFALQDHGWYLRSEVIWHKPNAQPESVRDRPTRDHEHVFLFSRSEKYTYHTDAIQGPGGRRLRTVWDINTKPSRAASGHFATFPEELVGRCVRLTSNPGDLVLDPFLGSGTTALVAGKLGRRFCGIELHPDYVDMARNRLIAAGFVDTTDRENNTERPCIDAV
ncbi:MAG: site-specific DNA-methyltransferase [Bifidobacteriaceae bacterium]|jgi:DNA modification methylase|nr:site-specific DNA-methyltransferase [Bifidobacteriaceae bacterium]